MVESGLQAFVAFLELYKYYRVNPDHDVPAHCLIDDDEKVVYLSSHRDNFCCIGGSQLEENEDPMLRASSWSWHSPILPWRNAAEFRCCLHDTRVDVRSQSA